MEYIKVIGEGPLLGSVDIQGSKNAVLPALAATILNEGETVLHNCPDISDVKITLDILKFLGCKIKKENHTIIVDAKNIVNNYIPTELMTKMRSSIIFLGAIIARTKEASMCFPGGCELGPRPIDLHIKALKALGVDVTEGNGYIKCKLDNYKDAQVHLDFPSVGATENIMLFGALSDCVISIENAAREPEIEDLQNFLNGMGAKISGAGSSSIRINGVKKLHDFEHTIIPDRIAAATYLCGGVITGGCVEVKKVNPNHFGAVTSVLRECGQYVEEGKDYVCVKANNKIKSIDLIRTLPHPGFPTDAQSGILSVLSVANGTSIIKENIFQQRFKIADELIKMGADINTDGQVAVVKGVKKLYASPVYASDLRSGAALVVAALCAEGETKVFNTHFIDRGYENLHINLKNLGANIERVKE
ncbi:MAG: UDP-N-acetylglucosamine 1-carboxyvinyltransferase [Ruminococcaceae bacterium]|nr:UDP-N-acetylglucosamine 1-carboxyvinyltransferase [Oscillospiraceae bacterium]